jgi:hypothetical protein
MNRFMVISFLVGLGFATHVHAESSKDDAMSLLDQLDQLDQLDEIEFNEAVDKAYDCAENERFNCADREIKRARALVFDKASSVTLAELVTYRKKQEDFYNEQKRLAAQIKLEEQCASSCPRSEEYGMCVVGDMIHYYCTDVPAPRRNDSSSSSSNSTLAAFSAALNQVNSQLQADLARQQADFQRQMQQYEAQRQERELRKQEQQAQQRRLQQQQQNALAIQQQQQEQARRQAEQRRKAEEERRLANEARKREQEARRLARQRENEQEEANKLAYLGSLKAGTRLAARNCFGESHVYGVLPSIQPRLVSCVNVSFTVQCPASSVVQYRGVLNNMISNTGGCYGDTVQVPNSISCPVDQFVVRATSVEGC